MGGGNSKAKPAKVNKVTSVVPKGDANQKSDCLAIQLPEDDVDDSIAASDLVRDDYYEYEVNESESTASRPRPTPLNLSPRNQKNDTNRQGYLSARKVARLQLENAAAGGSLQALRAAMRRAEELGLAGRELAVAQEALTRIEAEERDRTNIHKAAKKAMTDAIAARDVEALQQALQRAIQLKLPSEATKPALDVLQKMSIEKKNLRDVQQTHRDALAAAMRRSMRKELDLVVRKAADAGLPEEDLLPARKLLLDLEGKKEDEIIASGDTFWERPTMDMAVPEEQTPPKLPEGWETIWDEGYQAYYYCNGELGVSQWEPPSPAAMPYHHAPNTWADVAACTPPPPLDLPGQAMEYFDPVPACQKFQPPIIGRSAPQATVSNRPQVGIAQRFQQMRRERAQNASKFEATQSPEAAGLMGVEALQFICDNCGAPRLVPGSTLVKGGGKVTCTLCRWEGVPSNIARHQAVQPNKEITRKPPAPKPLRADSKSK